MDPLQLVTEPDAIFRAVDLMGVVANGLIGGAVARVMRFDLVGFVFLAVSSALGGGMIRDVLLGQGFPVALTDSWYLSSALAAAAAAYFLDLSSRWPRRAIAFADLLALGCWSATGASKALAAGLAPVPSIMLGIITGVGGGVLRDVMVNRVPAIFGGNPVYATFGIVGAAEMVWFQSHGMVEVGMAASIVTCVLFGVLARWRGWKLPEPLTIRMRPGAITQRIVHSTVRRWSDGRGPDADAVD